MEQIDGLPKKDGFYLIKGYPNDSDFKPGYAMAEVHAKKDMAWFPGHGSGIPLSIILRDGYGFLGPITPEIIESWDPEQQTEQQRTLLRLIDSLKSSASDAGHVLDIVEETLDLKCPSCGRQVDSLRDLLRCECGDPCCDECHQVDWEGCIICPECWQSMLDAVETVEEKHRRESEEIERESALIKDAMEGRR
jgi:hypothetical protein